MLFDTAWLNVLLCHSISYFFARFHRSHFTIKSVLTPLLLNKYARCISSSCIVPHGCA